MSRFSETFVVYRPIQTKAKINYYNVGWCGFLVTISWGSLISFIGKNNSSCSQFFCHLYENGEQCPNKCEPVCVGSPFTVIAEKVSFGNGIERK